MVGYYQYYPDLRSDVEFSEQGSIFCCWELSRREFNTGKWLIASTSALARGSCNYSRKPLKNVCGEEMARQILFKNGLRRHAGLLV